jgi:hypothetical protein
MLDFMHAGGFMMWPLLGLGVVAVVAAARKTLHGGEGLVDPDRLARAVLAGAMAWCALGLIMVSHGATDDPPWTIYLLGIGEALSPAVLGLSVYAVVGAIGALSRARLSGQGQA